MGTVWLPEESDSNQFQFEIVQEVHHDTRYLMTLGKSLSLILSRVQAIAWSPATSLVVAPKTLQFATSGTDHKLRLFISDLNEVKVSETQKP